MGEREREGTRATPARATHKSNRGGDNLEGVPTKGVVRRRAGAEKRADRGDVGGDVRPQAGGESIKRCKANNAQEGNDSGARGLEKCGPIALKLARSKRASLTRRVP